MQKTFLLDENVDLNIADFLKSSEFKVKRVPKGTKDFEVVKIAQNNRQILITNDSDFSNTTLYRQNKNFGIIVLKVHPPKPINIISSLKFLLNDIGYRDLFGKTIQVGMTEIVALK